MKVRIIADSTADMPREVAERVKVIPLTIRFGDREYTDGVDFRKPLLLGYTGLSDVLLQKYIADSAALWKGNCDRLPVCVVGSVVGTHVGPGAVAVAFFSPEGANA